MVHADSASRARNSRLRIVIRARRPQAFLLADGRRSGRFGSVRAGWWYRRSGVTGVSGRGTGLRSGLWVPLFDELADPLVVAALAAQAGEAGWHGVFVWDHVGWGPPGRQVVGPWVTRAAGAGGA